MIDQHPADFFLLRALILRHANRGGRPADFAPDFPESEPIVKTLLGQPLTENDLQALELGLANRAAMAKSDS